MLSDMQAFIGIFVVRMIPAKDYNSISPTAEYLVRLKALTHIPFAKEAAALLVNRAPWPESVLAAGGSGKEFFRRLIHFENRYWTTDRLLRQTNPRHILEISSGYSFRGLGWCFEQPVHFIDTDLPDLITAKSPLIPLLVATQPAAMKGKLELLPLNVMDTDQFTAIISRFAEGPVSIVNEGLLMYLGDEEKKQLCTTVRQVLEARGGYWITGDIYIRREEGTAPRSTLVDEFRKQHQIDENMFGSYEEAEQLFASHGLEVVARKALSIEDLSCLELPDINKEGVIHLLKTKPQFRESWCLSPAQR